jgi:hypothetical protein
MNIFRKSPEALIQEIHNEFDTAQDRLLSEAQQVLKSDSMLPALADRLQNVGFVNTPTAKKGMEVKGHLIKSKDQAETIQYYKNCYPFLKFLTENELNRICEKYGLIHAPVSRYTQEVPVKNLRDIETAQSLKSIDQEPVLTRVVVQRYWSGVPKEIKDLIDKGVYYDNNILSDTLLLMLLQRKYGYTGTYNDYIYHEAELIRIDKSGLFIAAPASHFDLKGLEKKTKHGFFSVMKQEVKDPIVFRYVRGGIQVITKWGLESNDPALVVDKLN